MKTMHFIIFVSLCLASGFVCGQQEVYDRFSVRDNLKVAYVMGYRVDSANRVDVILLRPGTEGAYDSLLADLNIDTAAIGFDRQNTDFTTVMRSRQDPSLPPLLPDSLNVGKNCMLRIDRKRHNIGIFYYDDEKQVRAIIGQTVNSLRTK